MVQQYASTERYTAKNIVSQPGDVSMVQVTDSTGMVVAILSPEEFDTQFTSVS